MNIDKCYKLKISKHYTFYILYLKHKITFYSFFLFKCKIKKIYINCNKSINFFRLHPNNKI